MTVPVSLLVSSGICVGVSACLSTGLAFHASFALSLVYLVRVLSPELVDGFFGQVDAVVQEDLRNARAFLRDDPLIAPIYACAEEQARRAHAFAAEAIDGLQRKAREQMSGLTDGAVAAFLWLRLAAGVTNLLATVLLTAALNEAKSRAPSVLRWRGVKGFRPPPREETEAEAEAATSRSKRGTTVLVAWISAIVAYCTLVFTINGICNGITSFAMCFPCFAALCGFALMEAERVYLWDSYVIDTRAGGSNTANARRRAGNAAGGAITEKDMRDAGECLWFVIIMMHCIDAYFLGLMLGNRPFVLASLAIYNVAALASARKAYLTTDEGEVADGAHVNVNKWHAAAMTVVAIDVAKVVATYVVLDFYLGALLFVSLGAKAVFLLDRAIYLSDEGASEDDDSNEEGADLAGSDAGDAEGNQEGDTEGSDEDTQEVADLAGDVAGDSEGSDDIGTENSSDIAACEHEEEEDSSTEKHSNVSDSEEQRRAESDYSSSGSSSVDDWTFVGADPTMPTNVNGGANRRFGFLP
ncbi:hypothetical protein CFC21_018178 [Triticum aestivum]|uniref:Uncharacterized protein n=3 Tax=Triticum TaxID=4564 RepID=A0A9R1RAV4_TRITD|nr:hypothetical protein CFC21_018178 [Triticum aestivum]VAH34604.1 unnamed protein product [Triticum turgidum subsp. durum]